MGTDIELRKAFEEFDRDGSGEIEVSELDGLLSALGLNTASDEVLIALSRLQTASTSSVTWAELQAWWSAVEADVAGSWATPRLRQLFDRFDEDGDGRLQVSELEALIAATGTTVDREAVFAAIQAFDSDNSGLWTFDEFVEWYNSLWER